MKFNKAFLGLGVMAFALASCSDDVEYTPAPAVTAPAAYFSPQEETVFDIEESDDHVNFKVYRAEGGAAQDTPVEISVTAEDGSTVPADLFDYTPTAHFDEGSCVAIIPVRFDYQKLTKSLSYLFDCKVAGNSSQYFLTQVTYDLCYTPWQTVPDCMLYDNTTMQIFGGSEYTWTVTVQEHPLRPGFFRIRAPYASCDEYFANYYNLPDTDPHYLYINATNPEEAYFADSKGNPDPYYNTGVYCQAGNGFQETYGYIWLACGYSAFLLEEDLVIDSTASLPYSNFSGNAGKLIKTSSDENDKRCRVVFGDHGLVDYLPELNEGAGTYGKEWTLYLYGASPNDNWSDLGMATYTDGFFGQYYEQSEGWTVETYEVPIQQSNDNEHLYRLVAPYSITWWIYGNDLSDKCTVEIDCTDPEFVVIKDQTALVDDYGEYSVVNAGYMYTNNFIENQPAQTKEEVIKQGLNDTFDEATGTININHPAFVAMEMENGKPVGRIRMLWRDTNHIPGKVVLPQQGAGGNAVAPKTTARKTDDGKVKIARRGMLDMKYRIAK